MSVKKSKTLKKYALDSSAVFYPYFTTRKTQSMFCVGAVLRDEIDKELLRKALNDAVNRFPLYKTKLRRGYGAYYLKENDAPVELFDLNGKVLVPIDPKTTNGYQFRVACEGNRVMMEIFHALTDANGAVKFLAAILRRYRELQGIEFPDGSSAYKWDATVPDGELEDGFKRYYKPIPFSALNLKGMAGGVPHRTRGTLLKDGYILDEGAIDSAQMLAEAKKFGVSATSYIAGVAAYGIIRSAEVRRPIVIMVPVNLRRIFPSETLSNFVTFVRLIVDKNECDTLEKCVRSCAEQLAHKASKEKMEAFVSTTVRAQKNIIFRCVPLGLKWIFIRLGRLFMKSRQTIIVSNLGNVQLPQELGVECLTLNLNVSKNNVQNLGTVSYDGVCRLTFTSAIRELKLPSAVFNTLEKQGIKVNKTAVICKK